MYPSWTSLEPIILGRSMFTCNLVKFVNSLNLVVTLVINLKFWQQTFNDQQKFSTHVFSWNSIRDYGHRAFADSWIWQGTLFGPFSSSDHLLLIIFYQLYIRYSYYFRSNQLVCTCCHVYSLFNHIPETRKTLVEEVHHATSVSAVLFNFDSLLSVNLDQGLRFSSLACCDFHSSKSLYDCTIRWFLLQNLH